MSRAAWWYTGKYRVQYASASVVAVGTVERWIDIDSGRVIGYCVVSRNLRRFVKIMGWFDGSAERALVKRMEG